MNYFLLFCFIFVRNILAQLYNESDILQEIPLEKVVVHSESKIFLSSSFFFFLIILSIKNK